MGGLSTWRGKFNSASGTIVMDRVAKTGTVKVNIDVGSIDFGNDKLNEHAKSADMFDVAKYPTAVYEGELKDFEDGKPGKVVGTLTLHGITKPLTLEIDEFLCKPHPMAKKEVCGADASAEFNRSDFGVSYGKAFGFKQEVELQIQVGHIFAHGETERIEACLLVTTVTVRADQLHHAHLLALVLGADAWVGNRRRPGFLPSQQCEVLLDRRMGHIDRGAIDPRQAVEIITPFGRYRVRVAQVRLVHRLDVGGVATRYMGAAPEQLHALLLHIATPPRRSTATGTG